MFRPSSHEADVPISPAPVLDRVRAPTLLIVGGNDFQVIELNRQALRQLTRTKQLAIVPGATHLFEEPGAMEQVSALARDWFSHQLFAGAVGTQPPGDR